MSLPTAKQSAACSFFQRSLSRRLLRLTLSLRTFGISIPTRRVPGIGASIRTLSVARFKANSLSRAAIFERITPAGGRIVYCVTEGPMLAPSTSTSIPKSTKVDLIITAFCWILPPSGGICFLERNSTLGIFQSGSEAAVKARSGSGSAGFSILAFFTSSFGVFSSAADISTPFALIRIGASSGATSRSAFRATRAFSESSALRPVRNRLAKSLNTVSGESWRMKIPVMKISTI